MRIGNNFSQVCLCVCLSVCLSVCLFGQLTFEPQEHGSSFSACRHILTISSLSIKVIGSKSRSDNEITYFN